MLSFLKILVLFPLREDECQKRNNHGCDQRATIDAARLHLQLLDETRVFNLLFARVHVARPARSHRDSSLFARLQQPESGHPEGQEDDEAQRAWRAIGNEHEGRADADRQGDESHDTSLDLFTRADVDCFGRHHLVFTDLRGALRAVALLSRARRHAR